VLEAACRRLLAQGKQGPRRHQAHSLPCPVCCELVPESELRPMEAFGCTFQASCNCTACHACLRTWIDQQLSACRNNKLLRVTCIGCPKTMPQKRVLAVSPAALALANQIDFRNHLEDNKLYPRSVQVECPRTECLGIGYLGFDTVMCFVCEHQWPASPGCNNTETCDPDHKTTAIKACPGCQISIEKDGGCNHMHCTACDCHFRWDTAAGVNTDAARPSTPPPTDHNRTTNAAPPNQKELYRLGKRRHN
jgi:hypothetical protein